jgi:hypothetical protein
MLYHGTNLSIDDLIVSLATGGFIGKIKTTMHVELVETVGCILG